MKTDQLQNIIPFPKKISTEENDKILFNNNKELRKYSFKIILDHLYKRACEEIEDGQGESLYNLLTTLSKKLENRGIIIIASHQNLAIPHRTYELT